MYNMLSVRHTALPKILCNLKMTFVMYEYDFGLAIETLLYTFNLLMNDAVMTSLYNSNSRPSSKITEQFIRLTRFNF